VRDTAVDAQPRTWRRVFPATPDQAREARRFLAALLANHPVAEDAVMCLSELAANAIQHSRSARPGGTFQIHLRRAGAAIRVEVTDQGGPWGSPPQDPERGRGLLVVRSVASRCDIVLTGPRDNPEQRTVWYEIDPP
jgi:serine/threonine-protein kinase RsbW